MHCLVVTQAAPGKMRTRGILNIVQGLRPPSPSLMSVCQGGRAGKALAVRERDVGLALQPLLGEVINFFWDLGRLI